jgi:putative transposase
MPASTRTPVHLWKKKYGQLGTAEIREMNELRDENTRLKRLVADLTLDKTMLQAVLSKKSSEAGCTTCTGRRSVRAPWHEQTASVQHLALRKIHDLL